MVIKNIQNYMTDTLIDRLQSLQNALNQAEKIILVLEQENERLKDAFMDLASLNKEDLINTKESNDDRLCAV
jgi:hypothetical protein